MKKNLLLLSALFVSALSFGQASFTSNVTYPTAAVIGQDTPTISFTYSSTAAAVAEFQIIPFDPTASGGAGSLAYGHNIAYKTGIALPSTGGQPVTVTTEFVHIETLYKAPADAAPTSPTPASTALPSPYTEYRWFGKLSSGGADAYSNQPAITITAAPLSVNSFNINSDEMYVTSAKSLVVKGNVNAEYANIYDTTGRVVTSLRDLRASNIDLSALRNGVYFLVDNNKRTFKFAL
jgi:hypothetical protein